MFAVSALADEVNVTWVDRFNGENNGVAENDYSQAIALDSMGNIYVSGFSFQQVQQNSYSPRFVTIKLSPDGTRQWVNFYRQGNFDTAAFVNGVDSQDNLVVSGEFFNGDDWLTIKYDSDGNQIWTSVYEANSTFVSNPDHMTIDALDNIYICGYVGSSLNPPFGAIVKIDAVGNQLWVAEYYGPEFNGGSANATAVDDSGHVYLAGTASVSGRSGDAAIVKFDSNGNLMWQRTDGSRFSSAADNFADVKIDQNGDIIVAGTFGFNTAAGPDVALSKYDADGNLIWSQEFDGGVGSDVGMKLVLDAQNNIIVLGYTEVDFDDYDTLLLKYDPAGNLIWSATQGGDGAGVDFPRDLAIDAQGNLYVVGTEQPFAGVDFCVTASYDGDGNLRWKELYGGPTQGDSYGNVLAVDPNDSSVYVSGESFAPGDDFDIVTIKHTQPTSGGPADVVDVQIVTGTPLDGGLPELGFSDDAHLHTRSGFGATFVDLHHMELIIGASTTVSSPSALDLTIEDRIDQPTGTAQVRLHNWTTGNFDLVGSYAIGPSDAVQTIENIDATIYVDVTGAIEVSIKHIVFKPFLAFTFESFIDQVVIDVR